MPRDLWWPCRGRAVSYERGPHLVLELEFGFDRRGLLLGPYSRTMPRDLWWPCRGRAVSYERGPHLVLELEFGFDRRGREVGHDQQGHDHLRQKLTDLVPRTQDVDLRIVRIRP